MKKNKISRSSRKSKGQAFVELALVMPVFIIMLAGMAEVVVIFNDYLQMLDAVRGGARFISDGDPYPTTATYPGEYDAIPHCDADVALANGFPGATLNFFRLASCFTEDGLSPIVLTPGSGGGRTNVGGNCVSPATPQDDIVISVFGTRVYDHDSDGGATTPNIIEVTRFDNNSWDFVNSEGSLVVDNAASTAGANSGWSFMADQQGNGVAGMCSAFTTAQVSGFLLNTAPSTGIVLVEVFYNHHQIFDMPVFGDIIPNPVPLHSYAFFPLVSAEPTSTPTS